MPVYQRRKFLLGGAAGLAIVVVLVWLIFGVSKGPSKNFNTISDTSTGLSFNMVKSFEPVPEEELGTFSYGFRPKVDPLATCLVSQTKLVPGGKIPEPAELRDKLLKTIRVVHPNAKLTNPSTASNLAKFGDGQGILLEMTFKNGEAEMKRAEVFVLGKTYQVIAYCESLARDSGQYYDEFTAFFSSLKLDK